MCARISASDVRAADARASARTSERVSVPELVRESVCQKSGDEYLGDWATIALIVHKLNEDCFESVLVGGAATRHRDNVAHPLWCQAIQHTLHSKHVNDTLPEHKHVSDQSTNMSLITDTLPLLL